MTKREETPAVKMWRLDLSCGGTAFSAYFCGA